MQSKLSLRCFLGPQLMHDVSYHCKSKWKSQGGPEKKIGWSLKAIVVCFFSTPACPETQNPENFRKRGFLILWSQSYVHPAAASQQTILPLQCGEEEREGFCTVSFFHTPLIHWDKLRPPLSLTDLIYHIYPFTSFPCRYFATQSSRPTTILSLQSWPLQCF